MRSVVVPLAAAVSGSPLCPVPAKAGPSVYIAGLFQQQPDRASRIRHAQDAGEAPGNWIGRQSFFGSSVPAIRRFISRNNASAASPRHVRHVAAPRPRLPRGDDRRLARAVVVGGCGRCAGLHPVRPLRVGLCIFLNLGRRLIGNPVAAPFPTTTAGPVISASFRPFRFGGRL